MPDAWSSCWTGAAAIGGGVLWSAYSVFEMLAPWGVASVYQDDLGYDRMLNVRLFQTYVLPGTVAVMLLSCGLLGLIARWQLPATRTTRVARMLAYVALGCGSVGVVGGLLPLAPLALGGAMLGSIVVGFATFLVALASRDAPVGRAERVAVLVVGVLGLMLMPLRPLVNALDLLAPSAGALVLALFGLGWAGIGAAVWRGSA